MRPWLLIVVPSCFYVTEAEREARFDLDGDGIERPFDCDDEDDGVGEVETWFADTDGDGFGDTTEPVAVCGSKSGAVRDDTDCDDTEPDVHPGAPERCDGMDNDCDQQIDEDQSDLEWYRDADGDSYGDSGDLVQDCAAPAGYVANDRDCDDRDETVNPDGQEVCGGDDEDCDSFVDEADPDLLPDLWYTDSDLDGFGAGTGTPACTAPYPGMVDNALDCDDSTADVHPGVEEVCNGVDDDCDSDIDGDATDRRQYYTDSDGDGFGDAAAPIDACPPPGPGLVSNASDCNDARGDVFPGAPECDDGVDNDCNPTTTGAPC